jgi:uncharacterized DUF497 family protein
MRFEWDPEKNEKLKAEKGISFEMIIFHLEQGDLWKVSKLQNQKKHPGQMIHFVKASNYIFLVPYVRKGENIFLKTIIPSRKATREYLMGPEGENEIR